MNSKNLIKRGLTSHFPHHTSQKGITLIALVITIIVLLILAGVTISMVLGDDGIIQNAQAAKEATQDAEEKDAIARAKAAAAIATYSKQTPLTLDEAKDAFTTLTEETYKNSVAKVVDGVPIPLGFAYVEGTEKDTGLIVVDGYGNEFVWIPVENAIYNSSTNPTGMFTKSGTGDATVYTGKLYDWDYATVDASGNWTVSAKSTSNVEPKVLTSSGYDGNENNKNAILESKYAGEDGGGLEKQFQEEFNKMAKSIETYGGFYVGRYETTLDGTRVASIGGASTSQIFKASTDLGTSWTDIYTTTTNENEATWYGLYKYQKELYNKESDSVVSGMIYGCQWDAIMDLMKDIPNNDSSITDAAKKFYIKNSTGMGVYLGDGGPLTTGQHKVNNIYDLAGNYYEWTQEAYDTPYRVARGGSFTGVGSYNPASSCYNIPPDSVYRHVSSRLQLYIK